MPSRQNEASITPKLLPHSGITSETTVTTSESSTVFLRPMRFISMPVGTEKMRNQKNTIEGKMFATESLRPRSAFT